MAMLMMMRRGNYENKDAIEKVIRYITRTRKNEDRANELVIWGGCGIGSYASPELAIKQFHCVQKVYGIERRGGRRMFHETLNILGNEFERLGKDYGRVSQIAMQCAKSYYGLGHQVVFAVHYTENTYTFNKGVHIHFAVNTVNFINGSKWHTNNRESFCRECDFNTIVYSFFHRNGGRDDMLYLM